MTGLIALIAGVASLILGFVLEGGHVGALWKYTVLIIVFGGTTAAVTLSFPISYIKRVGKIIKVALFPKQSNLPELIIYLSIWN